MRYTILVFFTAFLLALTGCGRNDSNKVFIPSTPAVNPTWTDQDAAKSCPSGTTYGCRPGIKCECQSPQYWKQFN